jgi:hypothetical protein
MEATTLYEQSLNDLRKEKDAEIARLRAIISAIGSLAQNV